MEKKKVLIINTVEFVMGGISSVIMNYFNNMKKDDMQIDFVVNHRIEQCYIDSMKKSNSKVYILNRNKNPLAYMFRLYKIMKKNKYDVVHVHGNSATMTIDLFPACLNGVKVRIAHSHNTECSHVIIHKGLSVMFKLMYNQALACSKEAGEWIFGKDKFKVLPNGIDSNQYIFCDEIRDEVRSEFQLDGKFVIGHVGFMNEQKNHPFLFEIFSEVKRKIPNSALLCVTGSDEIPDDLKKLINEYELGKDLLVLFKRKDVSRLLQAMDTFVFPSKWEGLGIALIEAQASGLPCVVSDKVAQEANVTGSIKYLSLTENKVWIDVIVDIYNKNSSYLNYRRELCYESQKIIRKLGYDIKNNANSIRSVYENCCKKEV